jgi:PhnB protein
MRLDVYVNYRGTCEEAFRFYADNLAGRITGIVRHGDQPNPRVPPEWKDKVLHARIEIGNAVLMGADPAGRAHAKRLPDLDGRSPG